MEKIAKERRGTNGQKRLVEDEPADGGALSDWIVRNGDGRSLQAKRVSHQPRAGKRKRVKRPTLGEDDFFTLRATHLEPEPIPRLTPALALLLLLDQSEVGQTGDDGAEILGLSFDGLPPFLLCVDVVRALLGLARLGGCGEGVEEGVEGDEFDGGEEGGDGHLGISVFAFQLPR